MRDELTFMLNEKRVKHMVKLASYENKKGAEELKISSFFRKDYVSLNVLISLIWVIFGYLSLAVLVCLALSEKIVENMNSMMAYILVASLVVGFFLCLIFYGVGAVRFYRKKHQSAKNGTKRYKRDLEILEKMYEREEA